MQQKDVYQFQNPLPVSLIVGFAALAGFAVDVGIGGANFVSRFMKMDHIDAIAGPASVKEESIALMKDELLVLQPLGN